VKIIKAIIWLFFIVLGIGVVGSQFEKKPSTQSGANTTSSSTQPTSASTTSNRYRAAPPKDPMIERIIEDYKANQARFHTTHKGNTLEGRGSIDEVKADVFGTGSIFFIYIDVGSSKVKCSTTSKEMAANLSKGQNTGYKGIIEDVSFGILKLENCIFK
jgi:tRNA_anti-like